MLTYLYSLHRPFTVSCHSCDMVTELKILASMPYICSVAFGQNCKTVTLKYYYIRWNSEQKYNVQCTRPSYLYMLMCLLGMPRYSIFHVICHGELCHDMLYVTT